MQDFVLFFVGSMTVDSLQDHHNRDNEILVSASVNYVTEASIDDIDDSPQEVSRGLVVAELFSEFKEAENLPDGIDLDYLEDMIVDRVEDIHSTDVLADNEDDERRIWMVMVLAPTENE